MHFGPQESYRLGDLVRPRNQAPDGDYVGVIDPAKITQDFSQKTQKQQVKVVTFFPQLGVEHTYWYNIHPDNLWALAQDLIASGVDAETNIPLPRDQAGPWVPALQQLWGNKPLLFHLETKKDYQNTSIRGMPGGGPTAAAPAPAAPPPAAAPSAIAPAQAAPGAQPAGNKPAFDMTGGGGGPVTGFTFMRPHTGPQSSPSIPNAEAVGPAGGASATDLFRTQ